MAVGQRTEAELMRWLLVVVLLVSCAPAAAAPVQTEDPRVAVLTARLNEAKAGTFSLDNHPQTLGAGEFIVGGIPDTFIIRIRFTATTPIRTRIMTLSQYVEYRTVDDPAGVLTYPATTTLDETFYGATGCGGYVMVFDAAQGGTMTPDFTITRAPSPVPTGECAN